MRYDVSQHAKAGQAALRRKMGKGYNAYQSINGKRGRKAQQLGNRMPTPALKEHCDRLLRDFAVYTGKTEDFITYAVYNTAQAVEASQ